MAAQPVVRLDFHEPRRGPCALFPAIGAAGGEDAPRGRMDGGGDVARQRDLLLPYPGAGIGTDESSASV